MSNLEQDVITTENEILIQENERLKRQSSEFKKEIEFLNQIFKDHPSAVVYNLSRFTMNSEPVWIDTHLVTLQELKKLDQDDHVKDLIHSKTSSRYNDDDW
tara:strand:- start:119 stop:421 length:303 start_codon:yes stop_codon:yes gene_type:complete